MLTRYAGANNGHCRICKVFVAHWQPRAVRRHPVQSVQRKMRIKHAQGLAATLKSGQAHGYRRSTSPLMSLPRPPHFLLLAEVFDLHGFGRGVITKMLASRTMVASRFISSSQHLSYSINLHEQIEHPARCNTSAYKLVVAGGSRGIPEDRQPKFGNAEM